MKPCTTPDLEALRLARLGTTARLVHATAKLSTNSAAITRQVRYLADAASVLPPAMMQAALLSLAENIEAVHRTHQDRVLQALAE